VSDVVIDDKVTEAVDFVSVTSRIRDQIHGRLCDSDEPGYRCGQGCTSAAEAAARELARHYLIGHREDGAVVELPLAPDPVREAMPSAYRQAEVRLAADSGEPGDLYRALLVDLRNITTQVTGEVKADDVAVLLGSHDTAQRVQAMTLVIEALGDGLGVTEPLVNLDEIIREVRALTGAHREALEQVRAAGHGMIREVDSIRVGIRDSRRSVRNVLDALALLCPTGARPPDGTLDAREWDVKARLLVASLERYRQQAAATVEREGE
jgi:hypothetical protein